MEHAQKFTDSRAFMLMLPTPVLGKPLASDIITTLTYSDFIVIMEIVSGRRRESRCCGGGGAQMVPAILTRLWSDDTGFVCVIFTALHFNWHNVCWK